MPVFSGARRVPARRVRPSLRDPRFAFLLAGQAVNSVGSWASAIVLWGFAAYRFSASPEAISVTVMCWSVSPAVLRHSWSSNRCMPGMFWAGRHPPQARWAGSWA